VGRFWAGVHNFRLVVLWSIGIGLYLVFLWALHSSSYVADPLLDTYLQMGGSLIAFTFAANALVRFRGTHDRISLILAFGFVLAGLVEAGTSMTFYRGMLVTPTPGNQISVGWLAGRTLLGILLIAALAVEKRLPISRDPAKEMAGATLVVGAVAYLTSVFYFMLPHSPRILPGSIIARPWDLLPALIYLIAAIGYAQRLHREGAYLDRALFVAAGLNVLCHVTMSASQHHLDAAYETAHSLMVMSYVVVLGGTEQPDDWNLDPDPAVTRRILADCTAVDPRLAGAEIVAQRVGLRPVRPRVRLDCERLGPGRLLVHNYGHGGAGVTLSWGCARDITEQVLSRA